MSSHFATQLHVNDSTINLYFTDIDCSLTKSVPWIKLSYINAYGRHTSKAWIAQITARSA